MDGWMPVQMKISKILYWGLQNLDPHAPCQCNACIPTGKY